MVTRWGEGGHESHAYRRVRWGCYRRSEYSRWVRLTPLSHRRVKGAGTVSVCGALAEGALVEGGVLYVEIQLQPYRRTIHRCRAATKAAR